MIEDLDISQREGVKILVKSLTQFYADTFLKGNLNLARAELDGDGIQLRTKDTFWMAFSFGMLIVLFFWLLTTMVFSEGGLRHQPEFIRSQVYAQFYPFRFMLMIALLILGTSISTLVFTAYKVNYMFIFDLDPTMKITWI